MPRSVDLLGPVNKPHDEALVVEVDGDAQVDLLVHDQGVVAHRGVEMGDLAQGLDRGPGHEREVREGVPPPRP